MYEFFKNGIWSTTAPLYTLVTKSIVHGRSISNPNLPVVNTGNRENPSYLPAEVCIVMPGQNSQSKLDPAQTQQMIRFAVRKPWENAQEYEED